MGCVPYLPGRIIFLGRRYVQYINTTHRWTSYRANALGQADTLLTPHLL
jgi:hypothetical protein